MTQPLGHIIKMQNSPTNPENPTPDLKSVLQERAARDKNARISKEKDIPKPEGFAVKGGIKSKERVQDLAEVFTAEREVEAMLDLLGDTAWKIESRFLEPACGNGNFLEEIFSRKLRRVTAEAKNQSDFEFLVLLAISSTYGIDISEDNIIHARERIKALILHCYSTMKNTWKPGDGFYEAVDHVLKTNLIVGDTINSPEEVVLVEYSSPAPLKFSRRYFTLDQLEIAGQGQGSSPKPFKVVGARNYMEMANES